MRSTTLAIFALLLASTVASGREPDPWIFSGNHAFTAEDLVDLNPELFRHYRLSSERSESDPEDAGWEIERFYLDQGFPFSRVEVKFVDEGAVFLIREGPRVFLGEVTVTGSPDADTLAEFVKPPKSWFLGSPLYVQSAVESAGKKMNSWLRQQGHLEAEVVSPDPLDYSWLEAYPGEQTLPVHYEVTPGPRYVLREITLEGVEGLESESEERLRPLVGRPYAPFMPYDIQGSLAEFFANRGYPYCEVKLTESYRPVGDEVLVSVNVEVDRGPRTLIGPIHVRGNQRITDEGILRELTFAPGDVYGGEGLLESQQRIFATNLFDQVDAKLAARDRPEGTGVGDRIAVPIDVGVDEIDYRHLDTSVGFGSWELARGSIAMEWLNLDGLGRSARIELAASLRGIRAQARAGEPWIFGADHLDGTLEGTIEKQDRPTFSYDRLSVGAAVSKPVAYKLVGSLGYSYALTNVVDVSGDLPAEFENRTNLSSVRLGLVREARNNPWEPTSGSFLSGSLEVADARIASDLTFLRTRLRAIQLLPLSEDDAHFVLVGIAELGAISPYGDTTEIPIQERYFLGGGQSVRSFQEDDLGPRAEEDQAGGSTETDSPGGGEFFSRISLELRIPVWGALETALFLDGGNVIEKVRDAGVRDYRYAIGGGIRYRTPLGPLRIDVGVNPSPRENEDRFAIFFAIGYPF